MNFFKKKVSQEYCQSVKQFGSRSGPTFVAATSRETVNDLVELACPGKRVSMRFVCVEVLRPSQSNGVMSSAVSLPNHILLGRLSPLSS